MRAVELHKNLDAPNRLAWRGHAVPVARMQSTHNPPAKPYQLGIAEPRITGLARGIVSHVRRLPSITSNSARARQAYSNDCFLAIPVSRLPTGATEATLLNKPKPPSAASISDEKRRGLALWGRFRPAINHGASANINIQIGESARSDVQKCNAAPVLAGCRGSRPDRCEPPGSEPAIHAGQVGQQLKLVLALNASNAAAAGRGPAARKTFVLMLGRVHPPNTFLGAGSHAQQRQRP